MIEKLSEIRNKTRIGVVTGPMKVGKTVSILELSEKLNKKKVKYQTFKPYTDRSPGEIYSEKYGSIEAQDIENDKAEQILEAIKTDTRVVIIDEAQFFNNKKIVSVVKVFKKGFKQVEFVIIAGLPENFTGQPFGYMKEIVSLADTIELKTTLCQIDGCLKEGTMTRADDTEGNPLSMDDEEIVIDDDSNLHREYKVVCIEDHPYGSSWFVGLVQLQAIEIQSMV